MTISIGGDHYRKSQPGKRQFGAHSQWIHPQTLLHLRLREHCGRQRIRKLAVRLFLLVKSEATAMNTHKHDCLRMSWRRMTEIGISNYMEKSPGSLSPIQRTPDNGRKLETGQEVFPKEEHTNWLLTGKWSVLKTHIQITLFRLQRLCVRGPWILRRSRSGMWEGLEQEKRREKCCSYTIISNFKCLHRVRIKQKSFQIISGSNYSILIVDFINCLAQQTILTS